MENSEDNQGSPFDANQLIFQNPDNTARHKEYSLQAYHNFQHMDVIYRKNGTDIFYVLYYFTNVFRLFSEV